MRPLDLYELTKTLDPRTALVLTPLAHIYRERPRLVALEQVPQVLPVWEAYAAVMREWGYSVAVGVLNAEQYGVPQTRRRAILVARRDGREAHLPMPTHSRYYPTNPGRHDEGVLPWVSMADALGATSRRWGFTDRPALTAGNAVGRGLIGGSGAKAAVVRAIDAGTFIPSVGDGTDYGNATRITVSEAGALQTYPPFRPQLEAWRWLHAPATTVAGDPRITAREHHHHGEQSKTSLTLTLAEATALQTFADGFPFQGTKGKQFLQVGNAVPPLMAAAILAELVAPPEPLDEWQTAFLGSTADHLAV